VSASSRSNAIGIRGGVKKFWSLRPTPRIHGNVGFCKKLPVRRPVLEPIYVDPDPGNFNEIFPIMVIGGCKNLHPVP